MKLYVLDTSVISAFAPGCPELAPSVTAWFRDREEGLHLSVVTLTEVSQGISKLRRVGGTARAAAFEVWLDGIVEQFGDRILSLDARTCRLLGAISDAAYARGTFPGFPDAAIAATALARDMGVLTRDLRHFQPLGVTAVDPLASDFNPP